MSKLLKLFTLGFLVLFLNHCAFLFHQPDNKSVYITAGEKTVQKQVEEQFQIKVSVNHALDVVGLNSRITYNPDVVEPVVVNNNIVSEAGDFFTNPVLAVGFLKDNNDNSVPGTLVCGCVNNPAQPTDGSGDMFFITFKAIAPGTTVISFVTEFVNLRNDSDEDIPVTLQNDSVSVPAVAQLIITVL